MGSTRDACSIAKRNGGDGKQQNKEGSGCGMTKMMYGTRTLVLYNSIKSFWARIFLRKVNLRPSTYILSEFLVLLIHLKINEMVLSSS